MVDKDRSVVKQLQYDDYEKCTVFYCNESIITDKNDAVVQNTVAANNRKKHDKRTPNKDKESFSDDASYASYCRQIDKYEK